MRKRLWISFRNVVICLLCFSCTALVPSSSIRYLDEGGRDVTNNPVITDDYADYSITLEPYESVQDVLVFGVDVTNYGSSDLYIDPRQWTLVSNASHPDSLRQTWSPLTTEEISLAYQTQVEEIKRAERNRKIAIGVVAVVLIVGVIIILSKMELDDSDGSDGEIVVDEFLFVDRSPSIGFSFYTDGSRGFDRQLSREEKVHYYQQLSEKYKEIEMAPTYIAPNERVSYEVCFRRPENMSGFQLGWEVSGQQMSWDFSHALKN